MPSAHRRDITAIIVVRTAERLSLWAEGSNQPGDDYRPMGWLAGLLSIAGVMAWVEGSEVCVFKLCDAGLDGRGRHLFAVSSMVGSRTAQKPKFAPARADTTCVQ